MRRLIGNVIEKRGGARAVGIIPARYGSSRLPGKPLAELGGIPMIVHVYRKALAVDGLEEVIVATDDERIKACVEAAGGWAFMTSPAHPSGTDRIAEVARRIDLPDDDIVVNIQGDQPLLDPRPVKAIVEKLRSEPDLAMTTPVCPLKAGEAENPDRVKVVVDRKWRALYFSRAAIPFFRDEALRRAAAEGGCYLKHIGLYAYRHSFLQTFVTLPQGVLENIEKLEQLRALENGYSIGVVKVPQTPLEVDTEEDLETVRSLIGVYPEKRC